jgi:hypothetical protein
VTPPVDDGAATSVLSGIGTDRLRVARPTRSWRAGALACDRPVNGGTRAAGDKGRNDMTGTTKRCGLTLDSESGCQCAVSSGLEDSEAVDSEAVAAAAAAGGCRMAQESGWSASRSKRGGT